MYIVISNINKSFRQMFVLIQKHPKNSYTTLNNRNHQHWRTPKLFDGLNYNSKGENNKKRRS